MSQTPRRVASDRKKPELTDADKALLEAEPDWERMGQGADGTLPDLTRRAGRALRALEAEGAVRSGTNARGRLTWAIVAV